MLLLCRHMHIEYYFLSVIALSAVDRAKRMMHSLTQGSENQRSKSCKCLSMWRKPSQGMTQTSSLYSRLWSAFSRLKLAETHSISSLSSTSHWRERLGRREGKGLFRTGAGRRRAVGWSVWNQTEVAKWGMENTRKTHAQTINKGRQGNM